MIHVLHQPATAQQIKEMLEVHEQFIHERSRGAEKTF